MSVWQDRFWEHEMKTNEILRAHIDYCYLNPVKQWLMCYQPAIAIIQSFHRDVALGLVLIFMEWFVVVI